MIKLKKYNGSAWIDLAILPTTLTGLDVFEFILMKGIDLNMTLKEFFKEFSVDELVDMYKYRIQDDIAKDSLKEIIMERLDLPDEASFKLWIALY
jgi:hypothetical protein